MEEFDKVVALNLTGTVLPTKVFAEVMAKKKQGVIINIASMASLRPITRVVGYSASKAAVDNFTHWLAIEMAKKFGEGIRVMRSLLVSSYRTKQKTANQSGWNVHRPRRGSDPSDTF
jgi:NAD(P)-dependent dehydrogenase (short-subunit alcohol dehydrogenase family)